MYKEGSCSHSAPQKFSCPQLLKCLGLLTCWQAPEEFQGICACATYFKLCLPML